MNVSSSQKTVAIIPARYSSTRFPGKPLKKICNMPMLEHVYLRAKMFSFWDNLSIATCDYKIKNERTANRNLLFESHCKISSKQMARDTYLSTEGL